MLTVILLKFSKYIDTRTIFSRVLVIFRSVLRFLLDCVNPDHIQRVLCLNSSI